jgi:hypothetical protein
MFQSPLPMELVVPLFIEVILSDMEESLNETLLKAVY